MRRWSILLLTMVALASAVTGVAEAAPLYPDLGTLPPRDLRFTRSDVSYDGSGQFHNVLRFTNTVWNGGPGKLETRGQIDPNTRTGPAFQRVFDTDGSFTEYAVGGFYWHAQNHQHYHYDDWGRYELWDKPDFDAWIASGRTQGQADLRGTKTTSCVMDEEFIKTLPTTPFPAVYPSGGCLPNSQNVLVQGLSVGWGDTYDYYRDEQWIDLDQGSLANGQYVLRSITDPNNKVYESASKADASRESQTANEGITYFTVQNGQIVDTTAPTGTVTVNDVDPSTASKNVTLKVTGRDDVSGVDQVRVSADGVNWRTHTYTTSGSTPTSILCDLTDPAIGGSTATGTRTLYAQFKDRSGKWGQSESDSIVYEASTPAPPSAYSNAVLADTPAAYWRLGETSGTTANDSKGTNTGTYTNAPQLNSTSLLTADTANKAVRFDGSNDFVRVPHATAISPTQRVTAEAWIRPTAVPTSGFASILTKPEAYSLQFNANRLEFTVIQNGTRRRTQAPAGAIVANQTYHVVGTYDGANARLYVNGSQVATTALTGAISAPSNALAIGSWDGSQEFFSGTVDDAAVYTSALSAARVAAHYSAGTSPTTPPPDPTVGAPSGLSAIAASQTQVELRWSDNATNESEFAIQRDTNSAFSSPTTIPIGENSTAFSDTGLTASTQYYYRVRALNTTDTSAWSNVATATTPAEPPPPATGYAQTVLSDDPLSYWRLGDGGASALDQRAINPGVYANGAVQAAPSLLASDTTNKAVTLDGLNDHVAVSDSASLDTLTGPITLEAWIKPTALPAVGSFASIATKAESFSLQLNGPQLELTMMQFGVHQRLLAPAGAIVAGQAYHVVGSFDGTTRRLYVNGAEVANAPLSGGATASSNGLYVGSWDGTQEFFAGTVDDLAVYGKALTAARVAAHFQDGGGTTPPPPPVAAPTGLTATATSTSQINLSWANPATNETEVVVQRDTSSAFGSPVSVTLPADSTSYASTGLAAGTQYFYRVRARNATTDSAWSATANATTQATPPPASTYANAVIADSPISYWRLGETSGSALDQRGVNAGTYTNAPTRGAASLLGSDSVNKAVSLDGTNDYVNVPNSASLSVSSPITLEAWIKPTTIPTAGNFASVLSKAESYSLQFNGPRLEFTIIQFGVRQRLQAPVGAIAAGQTYHVVGSYDGTTRRLYVNGVQVASGALTGGATSTTNSLRMGSWSGNEYLRGILDETAIYSTALSAARVQAHYDAGK